MMQPVTSNAAQRVRPHVHLEEDTGGGGRWSAVFAITLAACPVERSAGIKESELIARRIGEQADFINALFCPEPPRTLAIRYVVEPHPESMAAGTLKVVFFGKVCAASRREAEAEAYRLFGEVMPVLGGAMPCHEWTTVTDEADFAALWNPFPSEGSHIAEVRRREGRVPLETLRPRPGLGRGRGQVSLSRDPEEGVYLVHAFIPRPGNLARLLRTLLLHTDPVLWQVTLRPVRLGSELEAFLVGEIAKCERYLASKEHAPAMLQAQTVLEVRAERVCEALVDQLLRLQDAPYLMSIALASPQPLPRALLESTGVEVTAPVGAEGAEGIPATPGAGGYDVSYPRDAAELAIARNNVWQLAIEPWGESLASRGFEQVRMLVDAIEAAGAFRFPAATPEGFPPGLDISRTRPMPLPQRLTALSEAAPASERIPIGENRYLGFPSPVFLLEPDRRRHLYAVGQTGTGKTTLLKSMILDDIAAGRGLAVLDPHGDLYEELLAAIPRHRWNDVVLVDPTDIEFPVGLNLLEYRREDERHYLVREMRTIMERLLADQYQFKAAEYAGPAFYQHMQMNMLLVMSDPAQPGTLLDFYEIFQGKDHWRRWSEPKWKDPQLLRWIKNTLPHLDYTKRYNEGTTQCR